MTPEEFAAKMREIYDAPHDDVDREQAHQDADGLMMQVLKELGFGDGVEVFGNAEKWYA